MVGCSFRFTVVVVADIVVVVTAVIAVAVALLVISNIQQLHPFN